MMARVSVIAWLGAFTLDVVFMGAHLASLLAHCIRDRRRSLLCDGFFFVAAEFETEGREDFVGEVVLASGGEAFE
jgi:hypothetical protein